MVLFTVHVVGLTRMASRFHFTSISFVLSTMESVFIAQNMSS
jgi:hypothetical protein